MYKIYSLTQIGDGILPGQFIRLAHVNQDWDVCGLFIPFRLLCIR
jgi:hypothetical protein